MRSIDIGTKSATSIVKDAIYKFSVEDIYTCIPCKVTDFSKYESEQVVSLQPLISDRYEDGVTLTPRVINNVFVKLQNGGGFSIKLPVNEDTLFTLYYTNRDLDAFLNTSGESVTENIGVRNRNFYCTHGFGTYSNNQSPSQTDLIIEGDNTVITIKPSGEITTTTNGKVTLTTPEYYVDSPTTTFTGSVKINGNATIDGTTSSHTIEASSSLKVAGVEVKQHDHSGTVPPLA